MKRQTKILWIPLAVFIAVGCILIPIGVRMLTSLTQYCHEVSSWGALDTSIYCEINDYYRENKKYPDSLEELNLLFGDGASPDMLDQIQYQANETSCKYSYHRHAGKWNTNIKTKVEIEFSEGQERSYIATTPKGFP